MTTKLTFAGSLVLLAASFGQAVAGETITDKRYWPNETVASPYLRQGTTAYAQQVPVGASSVTRILPGITCTYQGGPKGGVTSCR